MDTIAVFSMKIISFFLKMDQMENMIPKILTKIYAIHKSNLSQQNFHIKIGLALTIIIIQSIHILHVRMKFSNVGNLTVKMIVHLGNSYSKNLNKRLPYRSKI